VRIRSTKPEFWRSNTIAELSWEDRFVLKGIEAYVDDNGVGKDDIELIATEVFPRDTFRNPRDTLARLSASISRIHAAGLIARYVANEEKLVYVDKWADIQRIDRPGKGRFPRPDGTMEYSQPVNRESYKSPRDTLASPRDTLATGTGEQGNRGTGEQREQTLLNADASSDVDALAHITESDFPDDFAPIYSNAFEEWWEHYPRKAGKRKAFQAWKSARKRASAEALIAGADRYAADPNRVDQFTKYPEGWLNADGWLDDPLPPRDDHANGRTRPAASDAAFAATQALKSQPRTGRLELE